ncbi:MAG: hypothetical protein APR54_08215 [Candidatus Cloacimonas sp. SDB]|nr:MAG: hypothetical protein APR54_08215 [Candidatus Cloacimonas sp. SDB]
MLINRFLAIIIIGGGFLVCKAIFSAHPLDVKYLKGKENKSTVISLWSLAFLIICGQLIYLWQILNVFFKISEVIKYPFFIIIFLIILVNGYFLFKNR